MKYLLSLDGGGVRGSLSAAVLVEMEKQLGKPIREVFSFIAGTSTGALQATALAAGVPATEILKVYTERASEIFPHGLRGTDVGMLATGYRFDPTNISRVMKETLGPHAGWTLNDSPVRLLLTAWSVGKHPWYFVQDRPKNSGKTGALSIIDCCTASASAPTYFSPWYVAPLAGTLVGWCFDGGVGVVANPAYQMIVEATEFDDFGPNDMRVISLGTGFYPSSDVNPPHGFYETLSFTVDSLLTEPSSQQTEIVNRHYPGMMQRFNWMLPQKIDMADFSAISALAILGQQVGEKEDWKAVLAGGK